MITVEEPKIATRPATSTKEVFDNTISNKGDTAGDLKTKLNSEIVQNVDVQIEENERRQQSAIGA